MRSPIKVCVVTGSRAEYGLLYWLIQELKTSADFQLQVVATGMHLSPMFGLTYRQINADGITIDAKVEMLLANDSPIAVSKSIGLGVIGFAEALDRLRPNVMVILGDRYEILAAAQAAMVARVPIAHLHGGEVTEGAIDEGIRHALTKLSHLHFVAAEDYRKRVIQMGEAPERVFNVGAPGLEHVSRLPLLDRTTLEDALDFSLGTTSFLVTYHPVTLGQTPPEDDMKALLKALDQFPKAHIIFTKQNADTEGHVIGEMIDHYVAQHPRVKAFDSLGQLRYLSAIQHVDVVIGNSSSGVIEVPAFHKATVNIGPRQDGRLKASSILDCATNTKAITQAIAQALSPEFQAQLPSVQLLYGAGSVSQKILNVLRHCEWESLLQKSFHDIN